MNGLRVLITNSMIAGRSGSELYAAELALELLKRGHTPIVYSPCLGLLAEKLREQTVPVVDDLEAVSAPPDIIHGQHNLETMSALLHFRTAPAVYFSHDNMAWQDVPPPRSPRILGYVAVDQTCRDRLVFEYGVDESRVRVLHNSVDLNLFTPRGPLPDRLKRALVFGNDEGAHLAAIREACARADLDLDVIGNAGSPSERPEAVLGEYDIVFAKGRCALEALAVGTAVVLCGPRGLGPMVTTGKLDALRVLNFGHRALRDLLEPGLIARELAQYDPVDAACVSSRIRAEAGREQMVDRIVALYDEVLEEFAEYGWDAEAEGRASAAFLRSLSLRWKREQELMMRSTTVRARNLFLRTPVVGPLGLKITGILSRRLFR